MRRGAANPARPGMRAQATVEFLLCFLAAFLAVSLIAATLARLCHDARGQEDAIRRIAEVEALARLEDVVFSSGTGIAVETRANATYRVGAGVIEADYGGKKIYAEHVGDGRRGGREPV